MNAKPWKESRSLINFGISDWEPTGEPESREIISEAKRHCPEFPFDPSPETTWIKRLSFYKDYRLVCLRSTSSENWLGSEVYGFYAPGDFRPVDGSGSTVEELNKVAPLILNSETILDYVLLRLRFELRGALDDANKKTQFLPEIVTGLEDLSRGKEKFEERELNDLARFLMSPVVETFPRKRTRKFLITVSAVVYADTGSWRSLRAKAYVSSSGNIPGDSIEVQLGRRYEGLSPQPGKAVLNVLRGRTAINIPEWYILEAAGKEGGNFPEDLVRKTENDPSVWRNTLAEKYGIVENDDVQRVILRIADLKFYKTFCLLEIQKRLSDSYMRSYALIRFHNSKADIRPLTGKSEVLHAVNADDDKPLINPETADEYLRFYCWAIHGEKGPFYIPRYLRELPFKSAPDPNILVKILKYSSPDTKSFPITEVDNDTASKMEFPADDAAKKKAYFFYLTVMSLAHFSIGATGLVSRVADEFISGDLDLEAESYDEGDLFTLVPVNRDEAEQPGKDRPAPKHYLNAAARAGRKDQAKSAGDPKNKGKGELPDLRQDLLREGLARGLEIHEPVIFNGAYFKVEEERDKPSEIFIRDCVFHETVRLTDLENVPPITFIECTFMKGLCAREARLSHSLKLINCDFHKNDKLANIALDLEDARLEGELLLFNCRLGGRFFAPGLRSRSLRLRGCRIAADMSDIGNNIRFDEIGLDKIEEVLKEQGWKNTSLRNFPAISLERAEIDGELEIIAAADEKMPTSEIGEALSNAEDPAAAAASIVWGSLSATSITVRGRVSLFGTFCGGVVDFQKSRCLGGVYFFYQPLESKISIQFRIGGHCAFDNSTIDGDVIGLSCRIGAMLTARAAQIKGTMWLSGAEIEGNISLFTTNIGGSLHFRNARAAGDVLLYRATVEDNVEVSGFKISGNLNCAFAVIGGLWARQEFMKKLPPRLHTDRNLEIGGHVNLSGSDIGVVELFGISVKKEISIRTGTFGTIRLRVGVEPVEGGKFRPKPSSCSAILISAIDVKESIDVTGLQIERPGGWRSERYVMAQQDEGFQLVQSRIGSDLSFFSPDLKRRMENYLGWPDLQTRIMEQADLEPNKETAPVKEDFPWMENSNFLAGVSFWGGLKLPANRIGGSVDLRCATVKGPIYLNDTAIGLDLYMDGSIEERVLSGDAQKQFIETTCLHLNAEKMTCEGDINFTGLRVLREMNLSKEEQPYLDKQKLGSLLAQEAQVKGQMLFVAKDAEAPDLVKYAANKRELTEFEANVKEIEKKEAAPANLKQDIQKLAAKIVELEKKIGAEGLKILGKNQFVPGYALIDGVSAPRPALDLTSVKAGYLLLTGCNVPHRAGSVRLERGAFGRLEIIEPSPGPIDLSKISVDRWVFGKNKEPRARDYVKVLEKMEPFDRSTWINVETALRNLAQDGEANKVYRKMRKKARADASRFTGNKYFGFLKPSHIYLVLVAALMVYLAVSGVFPTPVNVAILLVCVAGYHYLDRDGLSYLLGFGTFAWVPILLAIPLFFLSYFWVFSNPEYIRASSNLLEVLDDDKKVFVGPPVQPSDPSAGEQANAAERRAQIARAYLETSPDKIRTDGTEKWNQADAAALTLRYQVPIIPIMTHGWWEANSSQIKYFRGITAEQYALFLYYYHWIAWSLFLIWLAARIVRGKQN